MPIIIKVTLQLSNFYYDEVSTRIAKRTFAKYVKSNDQWIVTDVDVRLGAANVFQYERSTLDSSLIDPTGTAENSKSLSKESRKWRRSVLRFENASVRLVVNAKRTSSYYVFNLIAPLLVIVAISVFTAILPSESEQKPEIQLTVMLAFVFYQSVLSERVPKSEAMPLLGLYVMYAILLSALHLMCCHLVIRIAHLHNSRPPSLLIGRVVCLWQRAKHLSVRLAQRLQQSIRDCLSKFSTRDHLEKVQNKVGINISLEESTSSGSTTNERPDKEVEHKNFEEEPRVVVPSWEAVAQCLHYTTCSLFLLMNGTLVLIFIVPLFREWARNSALQIYYDNEDEGANARWRDAMTCIRVLQIQKYTQSWHLFHSHK